MPRMAMTQPMEAGFLRGRALATRFRIFPMVRQFSSVPEPTRDAFDWIATRVSDLIAFSGEGAALLFGPLAQNSAPVTGADGTPAGTIDFSKVLFVKAEKNMMGGSSA